LREIVHQGLADLVIRQGPVQLNSDQIREIVDASIEPDVLHKQEIEANVLNRPLEYYNWWVDHTLWARNLAITNTQEAENARLNKQSNWTQFLGWAFHFFTDRATPYHSPDKLDPMIDSIESSYEDGAKGLKKYSTKSQMAGGILNVGINLVSKAINLKWNHDYFEDHCEKKWNTCKDLTSEIFLSLKKPDKDEITLGLIQNKLDELYKKYKNVKVRLINSDKDYAVYMADIASVLDIACRFVLKN